MPPRPPLYARIEARLRDAIAEGRHPVGSLLPTEAELCASLKVSRHTVREALRRLVDAGLVERRQGAGSLVIAREPSRGEVHAIRNIDGLMQYASDTRLQIGRRGLAKLTREEAAQALAEPGTPWLKVEGLRLGQDGRPLATAEVLIHPRYAAVEPDLPERGAIYRVIEQRFGVEVAEVVQEISAAPMPTAVAAALRRRSREVGMFFMRRYVLKDGETLLVSRSWHPAERFTYAMRLRRQDT
ncbi:GntR family transcriptional regulator [Falsiroseomonas oryziterrae]|uniref:GntR family transcriptional regulator n=1 Tax=Falsiroseomonas oryziterrae TaxID=2911368 RepID=UPI001F4909FC|nr:GntR family transcriptional regulator [Roseomonas sp. NPKOSM-4]